MMNYLGISYDYQNKPALDESFIPFGVWARAYLEGADRPFRVALERESGKVSVFSSFLRGAEYAEANLRYMERYVKFLLWSVGAWKITVCGCEETAKKLREIYRVGGERELAGRQMPGRAVPLGAGAVVLALAADHEAADAARTAYHEPPGLDAPVVADVDHGVIARRRTEVRLSLLGVERQLRRRRRRALQVQRAVHLHRRHGGGGGDVLRIALRHRDGVRRANKRRQRRKHG